MKYLKLQYHHISRHLSYCQTTHWWQYLKLLNDYLSYTIYMYIYIYMGDHWGNCSKYWYFDHAKMHKFTICWAFYIKKYFSSNYFTDCSTSLCVSSSFKQCSPYISCIYLFQFGPTFATALAVSEANPTTQLAACGGRVIDSKHQIVYLAVVWSTKRGET